MSRRKLSNWTRPKPKIYDCNARDQELAYKSSYDDYLNTKEDIRSYAPEKAEKEAYRKKEYDNLYKYGTRRADSLSSSRDPPSYRRSNSIHESNPESTYLHSRLELTKEKNFIPKSSLNSNSEDNREESSYVSRISSKNTTELSADEEMMGIEKRLERLKKLREELGLPSEAGAENVTAATSISSSRGKDSDRLTSNTARSTSLTRSSYEAPAQDEYPKSDRRTRASARATAVAAASSTSSSSLTKRSSSGSRGSTEDYNSKYESSSPVPARRRRVIDDDTTSVSSSKKDSWSSKSSSKSNGTSSRVASTKMSDDIDNYDDDKLLSDIKKKFPTSKEIIDRIKEMDI